jgi:multiple sugar transport system substrate-binding protein
VSIYYYYRKFLEKSKVFLSSVRLPGRRIDLLLLTVLIVVIALVVLSRFTGKPGLSRHIVISVSPQFEDMFGKDLANALIRDFEEQRPDLRITKAEEGGDILFFDDSEFNRLRSGLKLLSLNPYLAVNTRNGTIEQNVPEQNVREQDAQWALPLMSFMDLLFYNIDILQAANFDRPPKTRAEFLAAARAVANTGAGQNAVYSFALDLADPQWDRRNIYPWIWAAGGEIYSGVTANDSPALSRIAIDTIAFLGQLYREGLLSPGRETGARRLEEFAQGKIAMIVGSARDIVFLQRNTNNINFGVTAIPGTTQGKNRMGLFRIYTGISAYCALPDEAWAFLSFIAGKSQILAEALAAIPGSLPAAFPGEYIVKDPLYTKAWDIFEAAEIVDYRSDDPPEGETERLIREKLGELGIGN